MVEEQYSCLVCQSPKTTVELGDGHPSRTMRKEEYC
jgi:hypothetical protein